MKVGRVCSGWKQSENGAIPPSLESLKNRISPEECSALDSLTIELFKSYLSKYKKQFLEILTASLLQYYVDLVQFWKKTKKSTVSVILEKLELSAKLVGINTEKLEIYSKIIHETWLTENLP